MAQYNITPNYYSTQTSSEKFYYITRYDNIDMMGVYSRQIPTGFYENLGSGMQTIPATERLPYDTNPSWATMQSDGKVKINRAGYYNVTLNYYAPGEYTSYYFTLAIRAQQNGERKNLGEQTVESLDTVCEQTVSTLWYFDVGDVVWATTEIEPNGGNHPTSPTSITITPYQFYSKFWG